MTNDADYDNVDAIYEYFEDTNNVKKQENNQNNNKKDGGSYMRELLLNVVKGIFEVEEDETLDSENKEQMKDEEKNKKEEILKKTQKDSFLRVLDLYKSHGVPTDKLEQEFASILLSPNSLGAAKYVWDRYHEPFKKITSIDTALAKVDSVTKALYSPRIAAFMLASYDNYFIENHKDELTPIDKAAIFFGNKALFDTLAPSPSEKFREYSELCEIDNANPYFSF